MHASNNHEQHSTLETKLCTLNNEIATPTGDLDGKGTASTHLVK